jgi:hypothetical protein
MSRAARRGAILLVTALGCREPAASPEEGESGAQPLQPRSPEPEPPRISEPRRPTGGLVPRWREGDRWLVRSYQPGAWDSSSANEPDGGSISEWLFTVSFVDDGRVVIDIDTALGASLGPVVLDLDWDGRLLFVDENDAGGYAVESPHVLLGTRHGAIPPLDWPRFPLEEPFGEDGDSRTVESESGSTEVTITQRAAKTDDGNLEVTVTHTEVIGTPGKFGGSIEVTSMVTLWEPGRQWWSSLTVRREYTNQLGTFRGLDLEAHVVIWPSGEMVVPPPFSVSERDGRSGRFRDP